jgi:hypothetical protein
MERHDNTATPFLFPLIVSAQPSDPKKSDTASRPGPSEGIVPSLALCPQVIGPQVLCPPMPRDQDRDGGNDREKNEACNDSSNEERPLVPLRRWIAQHQCVITFG